MAAGQRPPSPDMGAGQGAGQRLPRPAQHGHHEGGRDDEAVGALAAELVAQFGAAPLVVATGGLAPLVADSCRTIAEREPDLTVHGLRLAFERVRWSEPTWEPGRAEPPAWERLLEIGRAQLAELPSVEVREGTAAADLRATKDHVEVDGVRAAALVLATGMDYHLPDLPGIAELWGDTVFHCPFCHGWEVRGQPLAVLGEGAHAAMMGRMLRAWSDDVVVLADPGALPEEGRDALTVEAREVVALRAEDGKLAAVVFADGEELPRGGLLIHTPMTPRSTVLEDLGLAVAPTGTAAVDDWGRTSHPRVWAAGDVAVFPPSVPTAIASGQRAGADVVRILVTT